MLQIIESTVWDIESISTNNYFRLAKLQSNKGSKMKFDRAVLRLTQKHVSLLIHLTKKDI